MKYYIITPAKDEEKYISLTLDSVINQKLKPIKWIIVDDGSTDKTKEVIARYQKENDWIEVVSIENKQEKKLYGSKVIRAFNVGYNLIKDREFDFIVKLDADVSFPIDYFEEIAKSFSKNEKLGICGGYIVEKEGDYEKLLKYPVYIQGAVKSIRAACFKEIGGFVEANGWDGLDQHKAKYLGWEISHIPMKIFHHRPETTEYRSLKFFFNNGIAHYRSGNDLFLSTIRFIVMLKKKPYLLASISYLTGYLKASISNEPKLVDNALAKFIRSYHYKRLWGFDKNKTSIITIFLIENIFNLC